MHNLVSCVQILISHCWQICQQWYLLALQCSIMQSLYKFNTSLQMFEQNKGKSLRFEEKIEIFAYSANKDRPSEDNLLLLTPQSDSNDRQEQYKINQRRKKNMEDEINDQLANQAQDFLRQIELAQMQEENKFKKPAQIIIQKDGGKNKEDPISLKRTKEEIHSRPEPKTVVMNEQIPMEIQVSNISTKSTLAQKQFKKADNPGLVNIQQESSLSQKEEQMAVLSIQKNQRKEKDRATLEPNSWMKFIVLSPNTKTESQKEVDPPEIEIPSQQQKKPAQEFSFHQPGKQEKKQPVIIEQNRRITMDLRALSQLPWDNFQFYQRMSTAKRDEEGNQSSQQQKDKDFVLQYVKNLPARKQARRIRIERLQKLLPTLQLRLQKTKERKNQIQENIAKKQIIIDQKLAERQSRRKNTVLSFTEYEKHQRFLHFLTIHHNFKILKFQVAEVREGDIFAGQFILDQYIYIKIKKQKSDGKTEAKLAYSPILDYRPTEWLISIKIRMELLRLYFHLCLEQYGNYFDTIVGLANYYKELEFFDAALNQVSAIFQMQKLDFTHEGALLTFKMQLKPEVNFIVSVNMLRICESNYCDFFHIETKESIEIANPSKTNKFLLRLMELVKHFSQ